MTAIPDQAAFDLAVLLEQDCLGQDGATIVGGCCWLLAGLVQQAEREHHVPVERSIGLIVGQLITYAESRRAIARQDTTHGRAH